MPKSKKVSTKHLTAESSGESSSTHSSRRSSIYVIDDDDDSVTTTAAAPISVATRTNNTLMVDSETECNPAFTGGTDDDSTGSDNGAAASSFVKGTKEVSTNRETSHLMSYHRLIS